ncbi:MAG: hypothetical protein M1832_006183 [Thelocarpon impressellum]|nr:MAG: hypothetical protein M1832_006183 [Thelocarpon impressellum]
MAVKMEREKAAVKARWSAMSAEERMAALEKMQQEEMMACFVRGYEMSLRQLSTAQRRERILQGLNGMWLDIGLLGGNIRISSSQVNLCPAAP